MRTVKDAVRHIGRFALTTLVFVTLGCSAERGGGDTFEETVLVEASLTEVGDVIEFTDNPELEDCLTVGPEILLVSPMDGDTLQDFASVTVVVTHEDGVKGVHFFVVFDGESSYGAAYVPTKFCEATAPSDELGTYHCVVDTRAFPSGSLDGEGNAIGGEATPNGTARLVIIAEAGIADLCDPPRGMVVVSIVIDNP
jgi:hypothetical protein